MEDKEIEIAILGPANEAEGMMDDMFAQSAPKGRFSKTVMNALVRAYQSAQKAMDFGEGDMYPEFTEDITEFPAEFVRGLAMLASAAEDYGQPDVILLDGIKADEDVARLAAKIEALLADADFLAFLASPVEGEGQSEDYDDENPMGAEMMEDDMDSMFADRA